MDPKSLKATIKCRQCGNVIEMDPNPFRPFCSDRCRKIDLGKWFSETYRVSAGEKASHEKESESDEKN